MASFTIELKDAEMARVRTALSRQNRPATLQEVALACVDFLAEKVQTVEESDAMARERGKVPPLDRGLV